MDQLRAAVEQDDLDAFNKFLAPCSQWINDSGYGSESILHSAVTRGRTEMVLPLLKAGAAVNAINRFLNTPLHIAAMNGQEEICRILLENGADRTMKNAKKKTPAEMASGTLAEMIANFVAAAPPAPAARPPVDMVLLSEEFPGSQMPSPRLIAERLQTITLQQLTSPSPTLLERQSRLEDLLVAVLLSPLCEPPPDLLAEAQSVYRLRAEAAVSEASASPLERARIESRQTRAQEATRALVQRALTTPSRPSPQPQPKPGPPQSPSQSPSPSAGSPSPPPTGFLPAQLVPHQSPDVTHRLPITVRSGAQVYVPTEFLPHPFLIQIPNYPPSPPPTLTLLIPICIYAGRAGPPRVVGPITVPLEVVPPPGQGVTSTVILTALQPIATVAAAPPPTVTITTAAPSARVPLLVTAPAGSSVLVGATTRVVAAAAPPPTVRPQMDERVPGHAQTVIRLMGQQTALREQLAHPAPGTNPASLRDLLAQLTAQRFREEYTLMPLLFAPPCLAALSAPQRADAQAIREIHEKITKLGDKRDPKALETLQAGLDQLMGRLLPSLLPPARR
ncbi:hypothetical protein PAPYR_5792 [Paratrimastix pyriformis]|uniref:Uncharacterized protein n=1 Tax=Paratrimastix pyriformis TaxID=342808 RepID=A0ABQ8UJ11_9EUKA|nr:hypothetical protein PAPYR_5792 [Paratrimastix pyriformis]